jgi:hypothetical protein
MTVDIHSFTSSLLHGCRSLLNYDSVFYEATFITLINEYNLQLPLKASSLEMLSLSLIETIVINVPIISSKLNPNESSVKKQRILDLTAHSLFEAGEKDANLVLQWAQKPLFLCNNLCAVNIFLTEFRSFRYSNIPPSSTIRNPDTDITLLLASLSTNTLKLIEDAKNEFCLSVSNTLSMSQDDMITFQSTYHKESKLGKSKVLKAKFSLFNSGMNAIENMKGEWRITNTILKDSITSQLLQTISSVYTEFYNTYSTEQFSKKHMNEYLVYSPDHVVRIIQNFFEIPK